MTPAFDPAALLARMIATPSVSRNEEAVAALVASELGRHGAAVTAVGRNLVARAAAWSPGQPVLMLNSHLDTVKPAPGWQRDPFTPALEGDRLYGLGANDAGASLVGLAGAFLSLQRSSLPVNLLLALSAEEEVGGEGGMRTLLPWLRDNGLAPDMAIVGEPTGLRASVGERGLVVLDCLTRGVSGHAARGEGVNALMLAVADIGRITTCHFPRRSRMLGPVRVNVTQIQAGTQHNVVPDECRWVVDVRTTDALSNADTASLLQQAMRHTTATPRSTRVWPSLLPEGHPLERAAAALGIDTFVSPTTSDISLLHGVPALKIGPGDSARSHTADEYILTSEIASGLDTYTRLIRAIRP